MSRPPGTRTKCSPKGRFWRRSGSRRGSRKARNPLSSFLQLFHASRVGEAHESIGPVTTEVHPRGGGDRFFLQQVPGKRSRVAAAVGVDVERAVRLRRYFQSCSLQFRYQKIPPRCELPSPPL